jgi:hypothetical protein
MVWERKFLLLSGVHKNEKAEQETVRLSRRPWNESNGHGWVISHSPYLPPAHCISMNHCTQNNMKACGLHVSDSDSHGGSLCSAPVVGTPWKGGRQTASQIH